MKPWVASGRQGIYLTPIIDSLILRHRALTLTVLASPGQGQKKTKMKPFVIGS